MKNTKTKKDSHWFSHDQFAIYDTRMQLLFADHGFAGYGRWWRILEILRGEENYKYDICDEFAYKILAQNLKLTIAKATAFIADCVKYGLLINDNTHLYSDNLIERMSYWDKRKNVLVERAKKGAEVTNAKRSAQAQISDSISEPQAKQDSPNKTKQKETKQNDDEEESTKEEVSIATTVLPSADVGTVTPANTGITNNWDDLRTLALSDETNFVEPCKLIYGITPYQVGQLLEEFNLHLRGNCKPAKDITDYRAHFFNWMTSRHGNITKVTTPIGAYNIGQKRIPRKHIRGQ